MSAIVAIVGRPNVGKSTLFNRIVGKRVSIESQIAGTTRDRIFQTCDIEDLKVTFVDTGGIEYGKKENIENDIQSQAKLGIADAHLIYFVLDATQELTQDDFAAADILRKSEKDVILILNKCDNEAIKENMYNFYELGFEEFILTSAIHNRGVEEIIHKTYTTLQKQGFTPSTKQQTEDQPLAVSILGRPNVGKSSLVNALFGKEKVIVSDVAGTTRDATDTKITYQQNPITLIDTAGLRRRGKIEKGIEKFSMLRCMRSIIRSDICVLMINYEEGICKQDQHIAEFILKESKGLILVVNKCDLMEDPEKNRPRFLNYLQRKFTFIPWVSVVFVSAKERKNIFKILEIAQEIATERHKRIRTSELNEFIKAATYKHLPSGYGRTPHKILYVSQTGTNPPEFTFIMNNPEGLHFSYKRYLENEIRKNYGYEGTVIDMIFRKRKRRDLKKGIIEPEA